MTKTLDWTECQVSYGYHGQDDYFFQFEGYLYQLGDFVDAAHPDWGDPELVKLGADAYYGSTPMGAVPVISLERFHDDNVMLVAWAE